MIEIYDHADTELKTLEIDIPEWIDQDITSHQVASIIEGGCDSGAYMPAVEHFTAKDAMNKHGDDVLDYIQESLGELPALPDDVSWGGIACHYLSCAVELWSSSVEEEIIELLEALEDEDTTEPCPNCEDRSPMCNPECPWNSPDRRTKHADQHTEDQNE